MLLPYWLLWNQRDQPEQSLMLLPWNHQLPFGFYFCKFKYAPLLMQVMQLFLLYVFWCLMLNHLIVWKSAIYRWRSLWGQILSWNFWWSYDSIDRQSEAPTTSTGSPGTPSIFEAETQAAAPQLTLGVVGDQGMYSPIMTKFNVNIHAVKPLFTLGIDKNSKRVS